MNILQQIKDLLSPKQNENKEIQKENKAENKTENTQKRYYKDYIEELISNAGYREYTPAGITKTACPSCGKDLKSFPVRKMPCPYCNTDIYVRTRTSDKQKVLLNDEELEEFERQRILDSGRYDIKMENLAEKMEKYSNTGRWIFISALDEKDPREYIELHGRIIESGSEEEKEALMLLIRPDSRAWTKTWFNDPEKDQDLKEYERQKIEWMKKY